MSESIDLSSSGPPDTELPETTPELREQLDAATDQLSYAAIVAEHPASVDAWAGLGEQREATAAALPDVVEAYAYFRIGYHRGLDALRGHGWRGSGSVRWSAPSNRGFLRSLDGLRRMAERIGEDDEAVRCGEFLRQLDPDWPPSDR